MYRLRHLILVLVIALWATVFGWAVAQVLPSDQPTLRIACSSIEDLCRAWSREFTNTTGIQTQVVRASSGQVLARLANRSGAPEFDVWHGGTSDTYATAAQSGLLMPYRSPVAGIPDRYRDPDGYWTGTYVGLLGFCANTRVLHELGLPTPTSWDDLLQPKLRQLISISDPLTSGTGFTNLWTQVERFGNEKAALDWFSHLDEQVLQYTSSGIAPVGVVARGEAAVGVAFTQHCVKAKLDGADELVVSYPVEGTGYEVGGVAIMAQGRWPQIAKQYVDFALSAATQEIGNGGANVQIPTSEFARIDPAVDHSRQVKLLPMSVLDATARRSELLTQFAKQVRHGE